MERKWSQGHTSGEDKAEFWNGTGDHKTGMSTLDSEVNKNLQSADKKTLVSNTWLKI